MAATFDDFWGQLQADFTTFTTSTWGKYLDAAITDGQAFLEKAKNDLIRWTSLIIENKLTLNDVEWLVLGKKDLAELLLFDANRVSKSHA
jgi:hypothetical protein